MDYRLLICIKKVQLAIYLFNIYLLKYYNVKSELPRTRHLRLRKVVPYIGLIKILQISRLKKYEIS